MSSLRSFTPTLTVVKLPIFERVETIMIYGDENYRCPHCACSNGGHDNPGCPDLAIINAIAEDYKSNGIEALNRNKPPKAGDPHNPHFAFKLGDL